MSIYEKYNDIELRKERERLIKIGDGLVIKIKNLHRMDLKRPQLVQEKIDVDTALAEVKREIKKRNVVAAQGMINVAQSAGRGPVFKLSGAVDRADMTVIVAMHALLTSGRRIRNDAKFGLLVEEYEEGYRLSLDNVIEDACCISERMWPDDYEFDPAPAETAKKDEDDDDDEDEEETSDARFPVETVKVAKEVV